MLELVKPRRNKRQHFGFIGNHSSRSIERYNRLIGMLESWDYHCVICNREIVTYETATVEHLKPVSMGGDFRSDNLAPSHSFCNQERGTMSILWAAKHVEKLLTMFGSYLLHESKFDKRKRDMVQNEYKAFLGGRKANKQKELDYHHKMTLRRMAEYSTR